MPYQAVGSYLEFRAGTSAKFYAVLYVNDLAIFNWGRIGAHGQFKFQVVSNMGDAANECNKQMFAKMGKGYQVINQDVAFDVDRSEYLKARGDKTGEALMERMRAAMLRGAFDTRKTDVLDTYSSLSRDAHSLLADLKNNPDTLAVLVRLKDLRESFEAITEKHAEVQTIIQIATQQANAALMAVK